MQIRIYRGTEEIGGSCVEISTKNSKIILDYGTPLSDDSKDINLPSDIDAILISHSHQDHFGEILHVSDDVKIYCTKLSKELINATQIFSGNKELKKNFQTFKAWESFSIGDFVITPYLVDHSIPDAYAFFIESGNQKILYSGDFRANGRKSKLFEKMLQDKRLKNLDALLMEGTMINRNNNEFYNEKKVEEKIYQTIKQNNNLSFIICSSQNIDRIVSAYRASKKANKIFVIDIYTAWILEKMKIISNSIPNISWDDVMVVKFRGGSYYQKIKENQNYFKDYRFNVFKHIVEIDKIKNNPQKYFLKISPWHIEAVLEYCKFYEANIIYSQWLGYLDKKYSDKKTVSLYEKLKQKYNWIYAHTSGHADLKALQKFTKNLNPKRLIPMHTEYKAEFQKYFDNVVTLNDNEIFDI